MKKVLLLAVVIGLVGCGKSKTEKLETKIKLLTAEQQKYQDIQEKLAPQCDQATQLYQEALQTQKPDVTELKESSRDICLATIAAKNKVLEIQNTITESKIKIAALGKS